MQIPGLKLPAGLHIRPSMASDKTFLAELFKSTRQDLHFIDAEADYIEMVKEQQHQAQTMGYENSFPNAMYLIIEYHHEKVGRIVIDFGSTEIRIVDLAFIEKARNKGLGKGVLQSMIMCAQQVRAPLALSVMSANMGAKQLYASLGFVPVDIQPPYEHWAYTL